MVQGWRWSFRLPIDNARQRRLQELTSLLSQGPFSVLGNGSTFLARGSPTARFPILAGGRGIAPGIIGVTTDAVGSPSVVFALQKAAAARVAQYTRTHIGAYMAFSLDHTVISCPLIMRPIPTTRRGAVV